MLQVNTSSSSAAIFLIPRCNKIVQSLQSNAGMRDVKHVWVNIRQCQVITGRLNLQPAQVANPL